MNIAILLTGKIRTYHNTLENLQFLTENLKNHNIYFFCTTNFEENIDFNKLKSDYNFKIMDVESYNDHTLQFINNAENFIQFCESYKNDNSDYNRFCESSRIDRTWYHMPVILQKFYKGMFLIDSFQIKNKIKFDLVIRTRWDVLFKTNFSEKNIIDSSKSENLFVYQESYEKFINSVVGRNNSNNTEYHKYIDGWVDELFFYGRFNTMKKFSQIYFDYYNLAKKYNIWTTHEIFNKYVIENNISLSSPAVKIALTRESYIWHVFDYI